MGKLLGVIAVLTAGATLPILKLAGIVDWSWWWVTAPVWGISAVLGALLGFFYLGMKVWQR